MCGLNIRRMDLRAFDQNLPKVLDALLRERSSVRAVGLSQLAVRRRCGACAQLRRGQAVAATNLLGIIPLRLAEQVAPGAGLALHPAPFQLTIAHLCQVWHPHNTAKRAQAGLRQQVKDLFRRWATDHAADVVVTVMQAL